MHKPIPQDIEDLRDLLNDSNNLQEVSFNIDTGGTEGMLKILSITVDKENRTVVFS